jgi:L-malate glycosyltransferase
MSSRPISSPDKGDIRTVVLTMPRILHYRVPLLEHLRTALTARHVRLRVVHGEAQGHHRLQRDLGGLTWSEPKPLRILPCTGRRVAWLRTSCLVDEADLFIVPEAAGWLPTYELLFRRRAHHYRVGCWGHGPGPDDQARNRFTRWSRTNIARRFDWWFSYTDGTTQRLADARVDPGRITTLYNTVDVAALRRQVEDARARSEQTRNQLNLRGLTAVYLGALRSDKRLDLLLDAAARIAGHVDGFTLIVGGDGLQRTAINDAVERFSWLRYVGPVFGADKAAILAVTDVVLQPAAMGLVLLEAYSAGLPVVTFDRAGHGPEEEYLRHGVEGLRVRGMDPHAFADAVIALLRDRRRRLELGENAWRAGSTHSISRMAQRFADGMEAALRSP